MKNNFFVFIVVFFCYSCNPKLIVNETKTIKDSYTGNVLDIDSSYALYVRKVYKIVEPLTNYKTVSRLGNQERENLIEVNYLLLSEKAKTAIYMSTVPDKYELYYSRHYLGDSVVNLYDIKTVQFGRLGGSSGADIAFNDEYRAFTDIWQTNANNQTIEVLSIEQSAKGLYFNTMMLNKAFGKPVIFTRQPKFKLVYKTLEDSVALTSVKRSFQLSTQKRPLLYVQFVEPGGNVLSVGIENKNILYSYRDFFRFTNGY